MSDNLKLIQSILREKYPNDKAIQNITLKDIDSIIKIYCANVKDLLFKGYIVPISNLFMLLKVNNKTLHKKKVARAIRRKVWKESQK